MKRGRRFRSFVAAAFLVPCLVVPLLSVQAEEPALIGKNAPIRQEFVEKSVGKPSGPPLSGKELERRTHEVALLLRCPVCQGSSVADSPSETARNMKQEVSDLLALGYDAEQILRYFELAYGEFVRLEPKAEGISALVWIGPGLLLVLGLGMVAVTVRRLRSAGSSGGKNSTAAVAATAAALPGRGTLPEDEELARYVRQVREELYGWPGGNPPGDPANTRESASTTSALPSRST